MRDGGVGGFVHRTFLEYFCAAWFADLYKERREISREQLKEAFETHWQDEKWHEVLRLIAGMIDAKQAEELLHGAMSLKAGISLVIGLVVIFLMLFVDWRILLQKKKLSFNFHIWK